MTALDGACWITEFRGIQGKLFLSGRSDFYLYIIDKIYVYNSLYLPDNALIVQNLYIESYLFVFYCETYTKHIPRKSFLQCFTFHHHLHQLNIYNTG